MAHAGEMLENPLNGERIIFRRTAAETGGELLELDSFWPASDHRVAEHIHPGMREVWEVVSGTAGFRIGGVEHVANAGETVIARAGVAHRAYNLGTDPVHVRIQMFPALRWELFIERLYAISVEADEQGRQSPDRSVLLALMDHFKDEIALC